MTSNPLLQTLQSGTPAERCDAAARLGALGAGIALPEGLIEALEDPTVWSKPGPDYEAVAEHAQLALIRVGRPAVPALRHALSSRTSFSIPVAAFDFGVYIGDYTRRTLHTAVLAAGALGAMGALEVLPDLLALAMSSDIPECREAACQAIVAIGLTLPAQPSLEKWVEPYGLLHRPPPERIATFETTLAELGADVAMIRAASSTRTIQSTTAMARLIHRQTVGASDSVQRVVNVLQESSSSGTRAFAACLLGCVALPGPEVVAALVASLEDPELMSVAAASLLASGQEVPRAIQALIAGLSHPNPWPSLSLLKSLGPRAAGARVALKTFAEVTQEPQARRFAESLVDAISKAP